MLYVIGLLPPGTGANPGPFAPAAPAAFATTKTCPLKITLILAWADAHHRRTEKWPKAKTGPIPEAPGETWWGIDAALLTGLRGLPGGSSLGRLLTEHRGVPNERVKPRLTVSMILAWADDHHRRTGAWPACPLRADSRRP
jgi:hypothetical protein